MDSARFLETIEHSGIKIDPEDGRVINGENRPLRPDQIDHTIHERNEIRKERIKYTDEQIQLLLHWRAAANAEGIKGDKVLEQLACAVRDSICPGNN